MNYINNQRGITLVELLATLTIASFVLAILFQVLFNGIKYSEQAQNTASLQNEANYIVSLLTTLHETENSYQIEFNQNPNAKTITITTESGKVTTISNPKYTYTFYDTKESQENPMTSPIVVTPKDRSGNYYLSLKLVITEKDNPNNIFSIRTIISRM